MKMNTITNITKRTDRGNEDLVMIEVDNKQDNGLNTIFMLHVSYIEELGLTVGGKVDMWDLQRFEEIPF